MNTLYLDMDGVVADWDRAATDLVGRKRKSLDGRWSHEDWQTIRQDPHFYRHLPLMDGAHELVRTARGFRSLGWRLLFLTAIPRNNDHPWAFNDKMLWAREHFPDIPVHFGPYSEDKQQHTQPGDILVDDRSSNCAEWQQKGGTAIQVRDGDLKPAIQALAEIALKI